MLRDDRQARPVAWALAALAGYVDATGFLLVGGLFVSFMSGNTTRLAVGWVEGAPQAVNAALLIFAFFAGVVAGSWIGRRTRQRHQAILASVTIVLFAAGAAAQYGFALSAALALAVAMGIENATFERDGDVQVGLTYMTGALVKAGQRLAGALAGEDWRAPWPWLGLWLSLLGGAMLGALSWRYAGATAIWGAVGAAAICTLWARSLDGGSA